MESGCVNSGMDTSEGMFLCGTGKENKDKKKPVIAFVLGSGRSLWDFYDLRHRVWELGVEHCVVIGVNYSYRLFLAENHLFLDWEFWSQNFTDINKMVNEEGVQMFAPIAFDPARMERSPAPPLPQKCVRFNPYICKATGCKGCKSPLSKHPVLGFRGSATSVMPSINLAYLSGAPIVCIIGVEMNQSYHFWQTPRWHEDKDTIENIEKWHGMFIDIYGAVKPTDKFPNADFSLKDLKEVGKWLRRKEKVRAINCAVDGAVQGWEKMPLSDCLDIAEKLKEKKLNPPPKKDKWYAKLLNRRVKDAAAL